MNKQQADQIISVVSALEGILLASRTAPEFVVYNALTSAIQVCQELIVEVGKMQVEEDQHVAVLENTINALQGELRHTADPAKKKRLWQI